MRIKRKQKTKSIIVGVVLLSMLLQMLPAPQPAMAFDFNHFLNKIFSKVQIPNEFEFTEEGGFKLGTDKKNYLGVFNCLFKSREITKRNDKGELETDTEIGFCGCTLLDFKCGWIDKTDCGGLKENEGWECSSPFSSFKIGEWQTDLTRKTALGETLAIPRAQPPKECQLKIPLPDDDFALTSEEKSAHQAACGYFINLQNAIAQEVFSAKKVYNSTDPLSECFFLKNCKSSCSLRFGEVRYDITVLDILKFIIPGGALMYIQQIISVVAKIQKIVKIATTIKEVLVNGAAILNDVYEIINNFSSLVSVWQSLGFKWKDVLSVMTGPIGIIANRDRLKKGYDGFLGLIDNFSTNMIEYAGYKAEALGIAQKTQADIDNIIKGGKIKEGGVEKTYVGFKNEPEIGFLFADSSGNTNYDNRKRLDDILKNYQSAFLTLRGLLNNISAIGDIVGTQSIADRGVSQQECQESTDVYCTCATDDKCGKADLADSLKDNIDAKMKENWLNFALNFRDYLQDNNYSTDWSKPETAKCEKCWNNFPNCQSLYCPEGVAESKNKVFVGSDKITCTADEKRNGFDYCKTAIENYKAYESDPLGSDNYDCVNGFCDFGEGERFIPRKAPSWKSYNTDWFKNMQSAFQGINKWERIFNFVEPGYVAGVIDRALNKIPWDTDEDGDTDENVFGYLFKQLDYSKGPWGVYWQELAEVIVNGVKDYKETWIQDLIADTGKSMKDKHIETINAILDVTSAVEGDKTRSVFWYLASMDKDIPADQLKIFKFDKGDYENNECACSAPNYCPDNPNPDDPLEDLPAECPMEVCHFWMPHQFKNCLDWKYKNVLLEDFSINPTFIKNTFSDINHGLSSLGVHNGQLFQDYGSPNISDINRYWLSAGGFCSNASDCGNQYVTQYGKTYFSEVAESADWAGRISRAIWAKGDMQNIKDALGHNLSPENSVLVYYIVKTEKTLAELKDDSVGRLQNLIDQVDCGDDCLDICNEDVDNCQEQCDEPIGVSDYDYCRSACNEFLSDNAFGECEKICSDQCGDNDDGTLCGEQECRNACDEGREACEGQCPAGGGDDCEEKRALEDLKQRLARFFASNEYATLADNLNTAKALLRQINNNWESAVSAGNEAQIAREFVYKILGLIQVSQELVVDVHDRNNVCSMFPDDQNIEAPMPGIEAVIDELINIADVAQGIVNDYDFEPAIENELIDIAADLSDPAKMAQENIIQEIKTKVGLKYKCTTNQNEFPEAFLPKVACFENDIGRTFCEMLSFLDVLDILFQAKDKITQASQAIGLLEPKIKMEFSQMDPHKAVALMQDEPIGKFPFWEEENGKISIAGIEIKGFADFKKAVDLNPIVFLQGLYRAISDNLVELSLEHYVYYKDAAQTKKAGIAAKNEDSLSFAQFGVPNKEDYAKERKDALLQDAMDLISDRDLNVFSGDNRRNTYTTAINNVKTQNIIDLGTKVFGDTYLDTACRLVSPLLKSDPREAYKACESRTAEDMNYLGGGDANNALEAQCKAVLQADLSVLDLKDAEAQAQIDRLAEQRKAAGVGNITCPDKCPSGANLNTTCQAALTCKDTGKYRLAAACFACYSGNNKMPNGDWCWPPKKAPLDASGYTQGYQAAAAFCDSTDTRLRELSAAGLADICGLVGLPETCLKDDASNAVDAIMNECDKMEYQKAIDRECQYLMMLKNNVFNGSCSLTACSKDQEAAFDSGGEPSACDDYCELAEEVVPKAFCYRLTGQSGCSLSDIDLTLYDFIDVDFENKLEADLTNQEKQTLADLAMAQEKREKAFMVCSTNSGNIKTPLDEVMKIFSILIGIRSGTKLYNGVNTFIGDTKKMSDSFSKLIAAIKGDSSKGKEGMLKSLEEAWKDAVEDDSSGGLTITPLKCNAHPAESYSDLKGQKISGPLGGPVCPDIADFFGQMEANFGLVRNNLRQIDLARKNVVEQYLALPFQLNIHLFDKKEIVFPSINNLYDTAWALKQKAQFVWALGAAVNFASKSCNCGESYCKMPFCISGLPLAFGPITNASCYLTWILRYPMLKVAESLEDDLENP